jgi:hypothetical protein
MSFHPIEAIIEKIKEKNPGELFDSMLTTDINTMMNFECLLE